MTDHRQLDATELRRAFATFITGVTVVTAPGQAGEPVGLTANSFTSVSLDPPLLLVCIGSGSSSFAHFAATPVFAVNILREGQAEVASQFARRIPDRFAGIPHHAEATGSPILDSSLAWFDCRTHQRTVAGDHLILIGEIASFAAGDGGPLGFSRGRYVVARDGGGASPPVEASVTAYLIERAGRLLLRQDPRGLWSLPTAHRPRIGVTAALDGAPQARLLPEETFIYSVYGEPNEGPGFLVYRSSLEPDADPTSDPHAPLRWFAMDALPWDRLASRTLGGVLRRYGREREHGRFGVYVDTGDGGRVAMLQAGPQPWTPFEAGARS